MSLKNDGIRDLKGFFDNAAAAGGFLEDNLCELDTDDTSGLQKGMYYQRLDRFYADCTRINSSSSVTTPWIYCDPLFANVIEPNSKLLGNQPTISAITHGEWDRVLDVQHIYTRDSNVDSAQWTRADPLLAPDVTTPSPYPNVGVINHLGALPSTGAGSEGYYQSGNLGGWMIFETLGLAYCCNLSVRIDDSTLQGNIFAEIDLTTGAATDTGIPIRYSTTSGYSSYRAPYFGATVIFDAVQFVADDDSTPTNPKGRLLMYEKTPANQTPPVLQQIPVKILDFNPNGVAALPGNPSRTHLRELVVSRFEILETSYGSTYAMGGDVIFLHPPSDRVYHMVEKASGGTAAGAGKAAVDANENMMTTLLTIPAVAELTSPTEQARASTDRTVEFATVALGTLGERIAGVRVDFTLKKASTELETLDATTFPGDSTVANFPIDPNDADDPEGTLVVIADSVTLVETTDYTVVKSTGVITWVTDQSAKTLVTASYEHRDNAVTPPHGSLLATSGTTDANGQAKTRVRYADNALLVGTLDELEATEV